MLFFDRLVCLEPMPDKIEHLQRLLRERIVILDGAMGTMIQQRKLDEAVFRGERFKNWRGRDLKGCNDLLNITQPHVVEDIHRRYLEADADIIETNTFNSQAISLVDYGLESLAYELSKAGAECARRAVDKIEKAQPGRVCFVAGAIGPTPKMSSISTDINNPAARGCSYDGLVVAYSEQIRGLLDGGVDILLVETIFDTLNAKAAFFAIQKLFDEGARQVPIMASVTYIKAGANRGATGQTVEAFWNSISHVPLLSVGVNCAFGPKEMRPLIEELSGITPIYISAYPNAGLPNPSLPTGFPETPETLAPQLKEWAQNGWLNIVGGCCGTTPAHIKAIAGAVKNLPPRVPPKIEPFLRLSGLNALTLRPDSNFINIGESTNVASSPEFAQLIKAGDYEDALVIARQQVKNGAQVIDVCVDEGMIDGVAAMTSFLNLLAPVCKVPVIVNSSKWEIIEAGLKCLQGKSIVNSISLKEGEEKFLHQAKLVRYYGAAMVVKTFDERGRADTFERRIEVCKRAYDLLTRKVGFPPQDIIFDPNVLTVGTGMEEHANYAVDFIRATKWIKENLPLAKVSGDISNVSVSFRGNNAVREAMHSAFLYHAIHAGLDMGIVNAGLLAVYDEVPKDLLELVEDVLLNRRPDATERLIKFAELVKQKGKTEVIGGEWRKGAVEKHLKHTIEWQKLASLEEARANAPKLNYDDLPKPEFTGVRALERVPLGDLAKFIDWSPFFHVWELRGRYPAIFKHETYGKQARKLFADAQKLLGKIDNGRLLTARGVYGFFPANRVGDDVELYTDESRKKVLATFHFLRQQIKKTDGTPNWCLADFVAPKTAAAVCDRRKNSSAAHRAPLQDYIGAFAVTSGHGLDELVKKFKAEHDDYNAIMAGALADRLAEAFAEFLHKRVRDEWGYGQKKDMTNADLIGEKYRGIRPAAGYPACPDHTEKATLWQLLDVEGRAGMKLNESFAMWPGSSVSGLYFAHPKSKYFAVGKLGRDQMLDYHRRKRMTLQEAEKWLGPYLNYDPAQ